MIWGDTYYLGPLQKRILAFLKVKKIAHLRLIARNVNAKDSNVYNALLALKDKGLVKDIIWYEYFKPWGRPIKVRYWYLAEYEEELKKQGIIPPKIPKPGRPKQKKSIWDE